MLIPVLIDHGIVHPWLRYAVPVLIVAGFGIWAHAAICWFRIRQAEKAAGAAPTAFASPHAPNSFPAPARDRPHGSVDLLARDDR
ncbi:hypothetical protein MKL09_02940 [Methylobacterium sp. J-048]|uniref:hypothetical protein n=1 Tax=Methylobacterium sp. J-048 TaxID=2836635 RepID=UPI001FBA6169|nr:hypothetical protein [Methylobacterium sp. J-048]MCJ2055504.1 hypothetical protein [Methylobacterium sp. J-048]